MGADDAPAFRDAVRVVWHRISERLKADNSALSVFRNRAFDVIVTLEIDSNDRLYISRRLAQTCGKDFILNNSHRCGIV